ncbi:MAG TPA: amidohydrolase family protein [Xanthobacteraceae bacterium]|nr:amidohydrolase family protein [Xanthobacteraceae bacterium]
MQISGTGSLIPEYKQLSSLFARYPDAFTVMIHALSTIMQEQAPGPAEEIRFVDGVDAGSARFPSAAELRSRDIANITRVLDKIWSKDILRELSIRNARAADVGIVDLQKLILQEVYPEIFSNHPGAEDVRLLIEQEGRNLPRVAERLYDSGTERTIGRNVQWALLFTRRRAELAEELHRLHRDRAAVVTPALLDISLWVEDDRLTSVQDQVDVMTRVAARRSGQRVHGFVGFDPLRQAIHDKGGGPGSAAPLAIVQRAIERGGFIGVKLYPPMGFRPIENAALGADFPEHVKRQLGPQPGAALDRALAKLYAWCAANNAPIMAHAVASNEAGPGYGLRANPKFWAMVLDQYPALRINMAHFGGFREIGDPPRLEATWEWTIGRMFARTPPANAFADLSYYSEMLGDTGDKRKALLAHLASFRKAFPISADHLIFGSDWTMVGREAGFTPKGANIGYVDLIGDFLAAAGYSEADIDKIMFGNAVRFLGLSPADRQNGTRGRLEAFYAGHGRSADWLKAFDA